jgi:hypothetical protein
MHVGDAFGHNLLHLLAAAGGLLRFGCHNYSYS